jgi:pyruvate kinase
MAADPVQLYDRIDALIARIERAGTARASVWRSGIDRLAFRPSALNLASYLALRRHDLRPLQRSLMALGLSSLGRLESRVLPTLRAVRSVLAPLAQRKETAPPSARTFFAGEARLRANARHLFGPANAGAGPVLLVTCPAEAAENGDFMLTMAQKRVEAVRINCAHDTPEHWRRMIDHLRQAEAATGWRMRVFMDLAGPKIRTGRVVRPGRGHRRLRRNDLIALTPVGGLDRVDCAHRHFAAECTRHEPLAVCRTGDRMFIDDGRLGAVIERVADWGAIARVTTAGAKGMALKPERGLNFPDRHLDIPALTPQDRADLAFVCSHADAVEFSFVQSAADVAQLQAALALLRPADWQDLALVLKIETARAVANLPTIIVQAAGRQPTAIMIARGDLAVEIGFARTAEIQEEILWLGEAADVPVIWATQVLAGLIASGMPTRGEMTDAAMAGRAECVMLNKGPFLAEGIDQLRALLGRMAGNQHKKTPGLRALHSWADAS